MKRHALFALTVALTAGAAAAQPNTGRLVGTVTPTAYRLELTVDPAQPRFRAHVEIDVQAKGGETSLVLHGRKLHVFKVAALQSGKASTARYREVDASGVAQVDLSRALEPGAATLVFDYDAAFADGPAGLYRLKVGEHWYAWTQLEAIDARGVFPGFDQPEWKTPFTISVLTPATDIAISNAAETRSAPEGRLTRHTFAPTAPLPTYLVALAVGPFDVVSSTLAPTPQRAEPLALRIAATRGQKDSLAYVLAETKPIVARLEAYFDRPFPFSKLDQIASPVMGGAMENAGAVIYDDTIIVIGADAPVQSRQVFGMIVAHELAHQWFGDLVTPVWWDDIWLNESFANWLGYRIADQWRPELNIGNGALSEGFEAMELDSLSVGRPVQQPIRSSAELESAFDPITYGKGGKVVEMIESYLGPEKFRKGVRLYMSRFAGRNAASQDFFQALADAAGEPRLVAAMHGFVQQQGVPVVHVERRGTTLALSQSRYQPLGAAAPPKTRWVIPFCARAGTVRRCALLDEHDVTSAVLTFSGGALIPNAGGAGYYRFSLSDADWRALIAIAPQLSAPEALAVLDSLWAQWQAGGTSLPLLLDAAHAFVGHRDSYVVIDVGDRLAALRQRGLLAPAGAPAYRRRMGELFGPRLQQLGFDPSAGAYATADPDTQRLRTQLVTFMSGEAADAAVRGVLADAAAAWLDGREAALDRAYLIDALAAWLARTGTPGLKQLWKRTLESSDADLRQRMMRAMTEADDPAIARWVLASLQDRRLRSIERLILVTRIARAPGTHELGLDWLMRNFVKLAKGTNLSTVGTLFQAFENGCSEAEAARIEREVQPHVERLGLSGLSLARVVESTRNCGVLRRAQEAELARAFAQ